MLDKLDFSRFFLKNLSYSDYRIPKWNFNTLTINSNCEVEGTIIDLETTGLDERDKIATMGVLTRRYVKIYYLLKDDPDTFKSWLQNKLTKLPKPLYAYNAPFEIKMLGIKSDGWQDLMQYSYDSRTDYSYPLKLTAVTGLWVNDDISGKDVPPLFERWLQKRDFLALLQICYHNYVDLYRELDVLQNQKKLSEMNQF